MTLMKSWMYNKSMENIPPVSIVLNKENVPHSVFKHQSPVKSIEEAAESRGQEVSQLIRSILFRLGEEKFVLVMIAGPTQLSWPALRAHLGQSRMTMATKDEVLRVTGYPIGTVAPIGLPKPLRLLADKSVFIPEEISLGSGQRGTAIIIKSRDLQNLLKRVEIGNFAELRK